MEYKDFYNLCKLKQELIGTDCSKAIRCSDCKKLAEEWLEAEYVEPEVDWSKVEQGTKVYNEICCIGKFVSTYQEYIIVEPEPFTFKAHCKKFCRLEK